MENDILWMANFLADIERSSPMWVGWNSSLITTDDCTREIWYLPKISQCPTSLAVVRETMTKSLNIFLEYIISLE